MRNFYLMIFLLVFTFSLKAQVTEQEFQALKAIYNATGGDSWTNRAGWENINTTATKDDVSTRWFGISTITDGHVAYLGMYGNNLTGNFPEEIGNLQYLTYLNLGNNNLEGPLPQSLKNLTKLYGFAISQCKINGPFPSELFLNWPLLRFFYAGNCGLTGTIPDIFESTPLLQDFWIYNNQLEGELPPSINKLNLSDFNCSSNKFEGALPTLDSCKRIYRLSFSDNHFSGSIPESYSHLKNLQVLNLMYNNLSGLIPDGFFTPALGSLYLDYNYFSFEGIEPIIEKINTLQYPNYKNPKIFPLLQQEISVNENEPLTLNASTLSVYNLGGNNNRYKWFCNNVEVYSGSSPIYNITSANSDNTGIFRFEVTNTVVTETILYSDNITVKTNHVNHPPTNITLSKQNADENFTGVIGAISATDPDVGDTHTFSLATGDGTNNKDNNIFSISGNQLSINNPVDFEKIKSLNILIGVNDGNGGTAAKAFTITVNNVNEAPQFIGQVISKSIDETAANGFTVLNLTVQDPESDPITFMIIQGNENGAFGIKDDLLIVKDSTKLSYNVKNSYSLIVSASDGTLSSTTTLTVNLNKINHTPTNIMITRTSVDENFTGLVGTLSATDPDISDTHAFTLATGDGITNKDNNIFSISGNQLSINNPVDFEKIKSLNILIGVNDGNGGIIAKAFTMTVNNVNEAPQFIDQDSSKTIEETAANYFIVFNLNASDPEGDPIVFAITQGNENGAFGIYGDKLIVNDSTKLNYNVKNSYSLTISASDGSLSTTCTLTINLNDVMELTGNDILTFSVPGMMSGLEIDNASHTIKVTVISPNLSELIATFTLSPGATSIPASGTSLDFSNPQTISVTSQSGELQDWLVTVTHLVGKSEFEKSTLYVYPNPAADYLKISGLQSKEDVKLISLTGEVLIHKTAQNETEEINLQDLKQGSYFIVIESDNDRKVQKIIKL
jgi:hypothetical protein